MKRALFFFISIFFLGSCSIWYVTFSSESKSWTGQYKGHIKDDSEDGNTELRMTVKMEIQNLKI
ncbi:Lipoprotein [Bacillus cereus]|nr:Lipoprotein [Bacillus cereus]